MLKTKVKASSITNLTDARYFAAREVEWLGFTLDPSSEDYIQPQMAHAIKEWVDGVRIVGEFNLQAANDIRTILEHLELDEIQAGPFTSVETLLELEPELPVIKELIIEKGTARDTLEENLQQFAPLAQTFLLNFDKNGITWADLQDARPFSLAFLREVCENYTILLAISFEPAELHDLLEQLPIAGIAVRGGAEEKVGFKSFEELDDIFDELAE